jgi:hypothetical protein
MTPPSDPPSEGVIWGRCPVCDKVYPWSFRLESRMRGEARCPADGAILPKIHWLGFPRVRPGYIEPVHPVWVSDDPIPAEYLNENCALACAALSGDRRHLVFWPQTPV